MTAIKQAFAALILALFWVGSAAAATLHVAVAANFHATMENLAAHFEKQSGDHVSISAGSTGKLYAQILNGAPFDVFFAADARRPRLLEKKGKIVDGSRFTYATGQLVLWSRQAGYVDSGGDVLANGDFKHLAIANPKTAPYGAVAVEALKNLGQYQRLKGRLVRGQNIGQTFHFVDSGNVELGFVALSQISDPAHPAGGSYWKVPQRLYHPLVQQAVIVRGHDRAAVRAFMKYVKGKAASAIIRRYGYTLPDGS